MEINAIIEDNAEIQENNIVIHFKAILTIDEFNKLMKSAESNNVIVFNTKEEK